MDLKTHSKMIKNSVAAQKRRYLFLILLLIAGILSGIVFSLILSNSDKQIIQSSLDNFFKSVSTDELNYLSSFIQSLKNQVLPAVLIWLLGISIIGVPFILFYDFLKGFLFGFSVGAILLTYQWKGILKAFFYVFPHQILGLFLSIFLCFYALRFSGKLVAVLFFKKDLSLKRAMKRYGQVFGIVFIGFCFLSLMEVFLAPTLLRLV